MKCKNCGHKIELVLMHIAKTGRSKLEWLHHSKRGHSVKIKCFREDCGCINPEPIEAVVEK